MHYLKHLLGMGIVFALVVAPVMAQEDQARAFVEQALQNLAELPAYHFTYEITNLTELSDESGEVLATYTVTTAEGDALADGDNFTRFELTTGESAEAAEATPPLHVARTVFRGEPAFNFDLEGTVYEDMLSFESGWQSYEALTNAAESITDQAVLQNLLTLPLPTVFIQFPEFIESIEELDSTTLDDVEIRVFQLEIDALGLMLERAPENSGTNFQTVIENMGLFAASQFEATYELWIGMDDNQIYSGTLSEQTSIPYLTVGEGDMLSYDIATQTTITFTLSQHGEPVEIEPVVLPE